jgi:hypothetical protein
MVEWYVVYVTSDKRAWVSGTHNGRPTSYDAAMVDAESIERQYSQIPEWDRESPFGRYAVVHRDELALFGIEPPN